MSRRARSGPDPVDRHVGLRIRLRRQTLGLSQERLAKVLGVSFQQVQKYERATNRVSASALWRVAEALRVAPSYFYEGLALSLGGAGPGGEQDAAMDLIALPEGLALAKSFSRLRHAAVRRRIVDLVRALATQD